MLTFTKMHGLGNDFMVIDAVDQSVTLSSQKIQQWADRHTGVGFDQLLLIEKTPTAFAYKIYNADGSTAEQCGNGARCIARYILDKGWIKQQQFTLQAPQGDIIVNEQADGQISVDMGQPIFANTADNQTLAQKTTKSQKTTILRQIEASDEASSGVYELVNEQRSESDNEELVQKTKFFALSMGNPHVVTFTPDIKTAPMNTIGQEIAKSTEFPNGVNVEFVQVLSKNAISVRVLERGAGETLACGSGACAAMVVARLHKNIDETATVNLPGGQLNIKWQGIGYSVIMTGPAISIYHGEIA